MHAHTQVPTQALWIGIDIAKTDLEIGWKLAAPHDKGMPASIPYTSNGLAQFMKRLQRLQVQTGRPVHVICEPSGGYELPLLKACWEAHILITQVNPRQVRDFARSINQLAKTDKIDAHILSQYGMLFSPKPTKAPSRAQARLTSLVDYREGLIKRKKHLHNQLEHIDAAMAQTVASEPRLRALSKTMSQVKGVGTLTAAKLLACLPELGTLHRKQAAALAGLAPINHDSGSMRGRRHIGHGRPKSRQALYMAALVAAKHNPVLKPFYENLIQKGKAPKIALTALMRKLLLHLNSLARPLVSAPV